MLSIYLLFTSLIFNLDENLLKALITTETTNKCNYNSHCYLISSTKDVGLFQINLKYSGVHNIEMLYNNETNLHLAGARLAEYKSRLANRPYWWVSYNVGVSGFKRLKYPHRHPYAMKTMRNYINPLFGGKMNIEKEYNRYINFFHGFELEPDINDPSKRGNENGILFLVVYLHLRHITGTFSALERHDFDKICKALQVEPGLFDRGAGESVDIPYDKRRHTSHDNISAISSYSKLLNDNGIPSPYAKDIAKYGLKHFFSYNNVKPRFIPPVNPSNWSIWLYNGGYKLTSMVFLPFYFINLFITCLKEPGNTSSKQLYFTELYPVKDKFIWKYLWSYYRNKMIKMYGEYWLSQIFNIYYRYENHPIRFLASDLKL